MPELMIGVLALQGAFFKHIEMLKTLGVAAKEVRYPKDLEECDGLIIPGGESTTMIKQMEVVDLRKEISSFAATKPIFGTCAGLILMSREVMENRIMPLGILDIAVERNAFGRQADSFRTNIKLCLTPSRVKSVPAFFIRAPRIRQCGPEVKILAQYEDEPILIQQGFHLGATFHPELSNDPTIHKHFLSLIKK
jgi:5'-phosphate synthase pdxT subunit